MKLILATLALFPFLSMAQTHVIKLNYANDFFYATDRYFTQGVRLEYIAPVFQFLPFKYLQIETNEKQKRYAGIAIERNGFTPTSIRINQIPTETRPYAGTTFISNFNILLDAAKKVKVFSQIDFVIIGPAVGGKEEQTAIHKAIGDVLPLGWEYQISNDIIINYTLGLEKGIIHHKYFNAILLTQVRAGTLYTDASLGGMLRIGLMNNYVKSLTHEENTPAIKCYGFVKAFGKMVGYNATMQGGLFSNSIYTLPPAAIRRLVNETSIGITVGYKNLQLEYSKFNLSHEYRNGLSHNWGQFTILYAFN